MIEYLAKRWHIAPWLITSNLDDPEVQRWVLRGVLFASMEAVKTETRKV